MTRNRLMKVFSLILLLVFLSVAMVARPATALITQANISWFWTLDTRANSVATGDINGDGKDEVATGGWYNDGIRFNAFVAVLNGTTMAPLNSLTWFWTGDTQVSSVAVGDTNGDGKAEIAAGGSFFDGTRWESFVAVLDGTTLAPLSVLQWFWVGDTYVSSVTFGDINGDGKPEVGVGGSFFDGTRTNAFIAVLNGTTLAPLNSLTWFWTSNTYVNSVSFGDINPDGKAEISAGGSFFDNTRLNAFAVVLNGTTLLPINSLQWFWTSNTEVKSVAFRDVNGDGKSELAAGGSFSDNTRLNAFVALLNGTTLAPLNSLTWFWTGDTQINSIAVGNFSSGTSLDIVSVGSFFDGTRTNAHLEILNGSTFAVQQTSTWFTTSNTNAQAVAIGNFGAGNRIVSSGNYFDSLRDNAQLATWG